MVNYERLMFMFFTTSLATPFSYTIWVIIQEMDGLFIVNHYTMEIRHRYRHSGDHVAVNYLTFHDIIALLLRN